jgi:hypothetical protein
MLEPNADDPRNKEVRAGAHAQGRVGEVGGGAAQRQGLSAGRGLSAGAGRVVFGGAWGGCWVQARCRGQAGRRPARARARALTHSAAPLLAAGQAAAMLADNPRRFADTVKQTFQGRTMQAPPRGIDGSMGRERERPRTRPRTAGPGGLSSGAHIFPSRAPAAHTHARANLCPTPPPPTLPRLSCDGRSLYHLRLPPPQTASAPALSAACLGARVGVLSARTLRCGRWLASGSPSPSLSRSRPSFLLRISLGIP